MRIALRVALLAAATAVAFAGGLMTTACQARGSHLRGADRRSVHARPGFEQARLTAAEGGVT